MRQIIIQVHSKFHHDNISHNHYKRVWIRNKRSVLIMSSFKLFISLFALTLCLTVCRCERTDKTLVDKANGKDVVEAVDYLIKSSNIFPDNHDFVVRMAYVVTQFGEDADTFSAKLNIWGLIQANFDVTKNTTTYPALTAIYTKVNQVFGIDWTKVAFTDLSKPLIGALAVNMVLAVNQPVPTFLEEQAAYYIKTFSSHITAQVFHDKVKNMEKLGKCFGRMDLAIVLDGSGSIGSSDFKLAQSFVSSLVDTFNLTNVNLGFIVFSSTSSVVFPMNNNLSLADMKTKIISSAYPGSSTNTADAILTAKDMLLKATHREGSPRIMAIFTDGAPDSVPDTITAAAEAVKSNITLFAIGIGASIQQDNLLAIAQNQPNHVFSMSSYKSLSESFEMMNTETCKITQKPDVGKKIVDTLTKDEKRFFCYDLPEIGITVSIEVHVGHTDAFYSYSLQNPSSALNDGTINGKTYIPILQSKRVCVTVKGLEIQNKFTINSEQGNKAVEITSTVAPDEDDLLHIRRKAQNIAKDALAALKNYNQVTNQICNEMSKSYSKYEWICIVGEKVEISEHQVPRTLFQFGFEMNSTDFYFIVNVPDDSK